MPDAIPLEHGDRRTPQGQLPGACYTHHSTADYDDVRPIPS